MFLACDDLIFEGLWKEREVVVSERYFYFFLSTRHDLTHSPSFAEYVLLQNILQSI